MKSAVRVRSGPGGVFGGIGRRGKLKTYLLLVRVRQYPRYRLSGRTPVFGTGSVGSIPATSIFSRCGVIGNIIVLGTVAAGSSPATCMVRANLCGVCWNLVDRLVLGTSAFGVWVQVPPPPCFCPGGIQAAKGGRL